MKVEVDIGVRLPRHTVAERGDASTASRIIKQLKQTTVVSRPRKNQKSKRYDECVTVDLSPLPKVKPGKQTDVKVTLSVVFCRSFAPYNFRDHPQSQTAAGWTAVVQNTKAKVM